MYGSRKKGLQHAAFSPHWRLPPKTISDVEGRPLGACSEMLEREREMEGAREMSVCIIEGASRVHLQAREIEYR